MKTIFTSDRREIIAKTLFDTWKLIVPLTLASGFFIKYNPFVRTAGAVVLFLVLFVAAITYPPKAAGKEK